MSAKPFKMLIDDHRKVSKLFKELESSNGKATKARQHVFDQLKNELNLHTDIEEKYMYPLLENEEDTKSMVLEAYEEHNVVKDLLAEIEGEEIGSDTWEAKLKVMQENVEHHVSEEEEELFPDAEDILSEETLNQLAQQIDEAKASAESSRKAQ